MTEYHEDPADLPRRPPSAAAASPAAGVPRSTLSPRMAAVFGGLIGVAIFGFVFALLIQVFPVEQPPLAAAPSPSASASATKSGSEAKAERKVASAPEKVQRKPRVALPGPWRVSSLASNHRMVSLEMKRRSFIKTLAEKKVPKDQIYRIIKSMDGVYKLDRPGRRDTVTVAMRKKDKRVMAFEYAVSGIEIYQGRTDQEGLLRAKRLDMKVRTEEVSAAFYVGKNLYKSYRRVGLAKGLTREMNRALNGRTSTEAFEEGGVVRVVAVELTALGRFVRYERLDGLEYRPPDPSATPVRAYYYDGARYQGYVDGRGRRPSNRGWRTPVPGSPITSHFNPKRKHPILKRIMPHNGTDYGAPTGTPVYAAYRGKISFSGWRGGFGKLVLIDHPDGVETGYAHLSRFAKGLKQGQKIGTRQLIGYIGSTGRSTGPHLHFSAKRNGKFFDPLKLNMDALEVLPLPERSGFMAQKRVIDRQLEAIPLPEPPREPEPEPTAPTAPPEKADSDKPKAPSEEAVSPKRTDADTSEADEQEEPRSKPKPATETLQGADLSGDIE